jgi:uncharacterized membrane protein
MKKITFLALLLGTAQLMHAQQIIPASGGEAISSGGTSSYTLGQVVYTSNSDATGFVSQGVQRSFEFATLSNEEFTDLTLTAVTYPNPTTNYIVLVLKDSKLTDLSYTMYDLQGRKVSQGKVNQEATQIGMQGLATGTYILKVNQNNQELKTFKIIKK